MVASMPPAPLLPINTRCTVAPPPDFPYGTSSEQLNDDEDNICQSPLSAYFEPRNYPKCVGWNQSPTLADCVPSPFGTELSPANDFTQCQQANWPEYDWSPAGFIDVQAPWAGGTVLCPADSGAQLEFPASAWVMPTARDSAAAKADKDTAVSVLEGGTPSKIASVHSPGNSSSTSTATFCGGQSPGGMVSLANSKICTGLAGSADIKEPNKPWSPLCPEAVFVDLSSLRAREGAPSL
eukprot:gnl/TRDRNA2_/TRDRNA2_86416_c0_seq1.p1 gnl/TRDRNA2_/TRDRNA2_86416_c0~~gnl/TRDRNA2_/TRDRNA2_86416_c0_seq1.p1  ORF type:complete len:238 (+),score=35.22 gnl/TRDRNA2_/TRDRNA2_86416_c0_seq1:72-785(+)